MAQSEQTELDVLRAARAKVASGWAQGAYARNLAREKVTPLSGSAVCFCARGAVFAAAGINPGTLRVGPAGVGPIFARLDRLVGDGTDGVIDWNDEPGRTQGEVLDLFSRAIAEAESEAT